MAEDRMAVLDMLRKATADGDVDVLRERQRQAPSDVPMEQIGVLRRVWLVLLPWRLLPAHLFGLVLRDVEVHRFVFDVGDRGRRNIQLTVDSTC